MGACSVRVAGLVCVLAFAGLAAPSSAHFASFAVEGHKLEAKAKGKAKRRSFRFQAKDQEVIGLNHDPTQEDFRFLVLGDGEGARTELITLDPALWKRVGKGPVPKAWVYKDREGTRGGITKVKLAPERIQVKAKGESWQFAPEQAQESVRVLWSLEDEWYCAEFGGTLQRNEAGLFKARNAAAPAACGGQVCGNGQLEFPEVCDDGNLDEGDGCTQECTVGACSGEGFETTLAAIQQVVFDGYGCSDALCHAGSTPQGDLDLSLGNAHASLLGPAGNGEDSTIAPGLWPRVLPGDAESSLLYEKLAAKLEGREASAGGAMPSNALTLSAPHLRALELWIEGGAPADRVVAGTGSLLGSCLPPPDPLKIPVPDPPDPALGIQLEQPPWELASGSENELCMALWYDMSARVDPGELVDCPAGQFNAQTNPSGKCFRIHRQELSQDPQSHHSTLSVYTGAFGVDHPSFEPWTLRYDDPTNPDQHEPCDPVADLVPALGVAPGCSGGLSPSPGCVGFGPPDAGSGGMTGADSEGSRRIAAAGNAYGELEFADGVYALLPVSGVLIWNTHAFNTTAEDTTLAQYLNLYFAGPGDRQWPVRYVTDSDDIFVQNVPPFETRLYCSTHTAAVGTRMFELSSHNHRHGVLWRTWAPPNAICSPDPDGDPEAPFCVPREDAPFYTSTDYVDPVRLRYDPPWALDDPDPEDRTFLFCAVYDNGATPISPPVKRYSTSPPPAIPLAPGGPCLPSEVACLEGPRKGELCDVDGSFGVGADDHAFCDSSPGSADGECDACPLRGGITSEDEMLVLTGNYYLEE